MLNDWLSKIKGSTPINNIGIPGTHDTASVSGMGGGMLQLPITYTQQLDFETQLKTGARVLDMRVAYQPKTKDGWIFSGTDEDIYMCHGKCVFNITLLEQLKVVKRFVDTNPSEFVVLMFQQQGWNKDASVERQTRLVEQKVLSTFPPTHRFIPAQAGGTWPTVSQLKQKVMLFSRLESTPHRTFFDIRQWGAKAVSDAFNVPNTALRILLQDRYTEVTSALDSFKGKYSSSADDVTAAKLHLVHRMRTLGNADNTLKINHLSHSKLASTHCQPYMLGQKLNPKFQESLDNGEHYRGFLMLDDLNKDVAEAIVKSNSHLFRNKPRHPDHLAHRALFAEIRRQ